MGSTEPNPLNLFCKSKPCFDEHVTQDIQAIKIFGTIANEINNMKYNPLVIDVCHMNKRVEY